MNKTILSIWITILLTIILLTPIGFSNKVKVNENEILIENYDCYNASEISGYGPISGYESKNFIDTESEEVNISNDTSKPLEGSINSSWPMYCHDVHHTGRSPYSTISNNGFERWQLGLHGLVWGAPVIDDDGIIYIGAWDFYAVYPNGAIKWQNDISAFSSAAAIDENGVLYVGTIWAMPNYLYAIYKNNGTLKWKFPTGDDIFSSPAIGDDNTIYFGCEDYNIYALYPNSTLKWKYTTGDAVLSSPAIGVDGTVFCGSHDGNLYAFYPNNGTVKWKFGTGNWIRTSPCIADDGTIYCVSLDGYLYAIFSDGTFKWKTDVGAGTSPTIGPDGTIYCGYDKLYAINPNSGSVKWTFDVGGKIRGATPCNSIDGTIYLGNYDGSDIIAVNPDGTEKWREYIGGDVESAPAIDDDGTVYIGDGREDGSLHAFGSIDPNAPGTPIINGSTNGKVRLSYEYTFTTTDPNGDDVFYYITWGDGTSDGWLGPHGSGEDVKVNHTWSKTGIYLILAQAKDTNDLKSEWGTLEVTMPRNKDTTKMFYYRLLERFPSLMQLMNFLFYVK